MVTLSSIYSIIFIEKKNIWLDILGACGSLAFYLLQCSELRHIIGCGINPFFFSPTSFSVFRSVRRRADCLWWFLAHFDFLSKWPSLLYFIMSSSPAHRLLRVIDVFGAARPFPPSGWRCFQSNYIKTLITFLRKANGKLQRYITECSRRVSITCLNAKINRKTLAENVFSSILAEKDYMGFIDNSLILASCKYYHIGFILS